MTFRDVLISFLGRFGDRAGGCLFLWNHIFGGRLRVSQANRQRLLQANRSIRCFTCPLGGSSPGGDYYKFQILEDKEKRKLYDEGLDKKAIEAIEKSKK